MSAITNLSNTINIGQHKYKHVIKFPISNLAIDLIVGLFHGSFIRGFFIDKFKTQNCIFILLKYGSNKRICQKISFIHKTNSYTKHTNLLKYKNGLGLYLISTTKGIMTNYEASNLKLGGILLIKIS